MLRKSNIAFLAILLAFALSGCAKQPPASDQTSLANPASVNCAKQGGNLQIKERNNGQYGVCYFEDNRQCEEWALLRGDCPVGGLKVAGYDNDAEIYCAITGGQVEGLDTPVPMCKRTDGTYCNAQANFDGDCPAPGDQSANAGNDVGVDLKALFSAKYPKYADTISVDVNQLQPDYARGVVSFESGQPGGNFLAKKTDGKWKIMFDGNGQIPCALENDGFPKTMLADCAK